MAVIHVDHPKPSFGLRRIASVVWHALMRTAEANARMRQIAYLQQLSDEELAKRGLKREEIVGHVFSDLMYT